MKLLSKLARLAQKLVDNGLGGGLAQEMNKPVGERYVTPGMGEAVRAAASEGIVLLENDGVLPLARGARVAVFGRCQFDYFYVGYGSGGDVHPPYTVSPAAAFAAAEKEGRLTCNAALRKVYEEWRARSANRSDDGWWGHWPMHYPEMPVSPALAAEAAAESDVAVVIIGRAAGEDRDNKPEPGSYYLTPDGARSARRGHGCVCKDGRRTGLRQHHRPRMGKGMQGAHFGARVRLAWGDGERQRAPLRADG